CARHRPYYFSASYWANWFDVW
nr:immunoglobulin heavy chain junction region [Macaca mulatta]MOX63881.1 immunoglobulin heavy chain junction region [Macaca mulatta]MOX67968.1 immunoglobulin heavy chain junction region [Macaca mulatta]